MKNYKSIKGYENLYEISNEGEVISLYFGKRKVLKQGLMTSGYKIVSLKKNKKQKMFSVHRLLAGHFIPNELNLEQVNHKDGNKLNNLLENLEWCTRSQNIQHAYDTGIKTYRPLHYKGKFGAEHNRSKKVRCIETGTEYGSMSQASRELGISVSSIHLSVKKNLPVFNKNFEIAS